MGRLRVRHSAGAARPKHRATKHAVQQTAMPGGPHRLSAIDTTHGVIQRYYTPNQSEIGRYFWVVLPDGRLEQLALIGLAPDGGGIFQIPSGPLTVGPFAIYQNRPLPLFEERDDDPTNVDEDLPDREEFVPSETQGLALEPQHVSLLSQATPQSAFNAPVEHYDSATLHRRLYAEGVLSTRPRGSKITQNQVRCALSLVIRTTDGELHAITRLLGETFGSGETGKKSQIKRLIKWLVGNGIIANAKKYRSDAHAHSEQWFVLDMIDHVDGVLGELLAGIESDETIVGVILDVASAPNTVCGPCHQSLDALMATSIVPAVEKLTAHRPVIALVNASGEQKFKGVGRDNVDKAVWSEFLIRYGAIAKQESTSRQQERRSGRRSRGLGEETEQPDEDAPSLTLEETREALSRHGSVVAVTGDRLACYIRAILTALAEREVIARDQIENLVATITDHLANVGLRIGDRMIDAGGIAAAEVRRVIAELTQHLVQGGIDVGITVYQWDPARLGFVHFVANIGRYQVELLYTPGHFDAFLQ